MKCTDEMFEAARDAFLRSPRIESIRQYDDAIRAAIDAALAKAPPVAVPGAAVREVLREMRACDSDGIELHAVSVYADKLEAAIAADGLGAAPRLPSSPTTSVQVSHDASGTRVYVGGAEYVPKVEPPQLPSEEELARKLWSAYLIGAYGSDAGADRIGQRERVGVLAEARYVLDLLRKHAPPQPAELVTREAEREQWRSQLEASERGRAELAAELADCQARLKGTLALADQHVADKARLDHELVACRAELDAACDTVHKIANVLGLVEHGDGGDLGNFAQADDAEIIAAARELALAEDKLVDTLRERDKLKLKCSRQAKSIARLEALRREVLDTHYRAWEAADKQRVQAEQERDRLQTELAKLRELSAKTDPCESYTLQLRRIADAAGVDAAIDEVDVLVIEAIGKLREQLEALRAQSARALAAFDSCGPGAWAQFNRLRPLLAPAATEAEPYSARRALANVEALVRGDEAAKTQASNALDQAEWSAPPVPLPEPLSDARRREVLDGMRAERLECALRCFLDAWATSPRPRHDAAVEALAMLDENGGA